MMLLGCFNISNTSDSGPSSLDTGHRFVCTWMPLLPPNCSRCWLPTSAWSSFHWWLCFYWNIGYSLPAVPCTYENCPHELSDHVSPRMIWWDSHLCSLSPPIKLPSRKVWATFCAPTKVLEFLFFLVTLCWRRMHALGVSHSCFPCKHSACILKWKKVTVI